jgi:tRNA (guanosine-2'-O-)-methyltransferase
MNPERFARLRRALERRQPDLTVVMDRVSKAYNFSAMVRSCDAVGVLDAHVVPPYGGLDVHNAMSAGTKKWVAVHRHANVTEALEPLKASGFQVLAAHPSDGSIDFRDADYTGPTAVLMGAERPGVSPEGLNLADRHIVIPMLGMVHSLNVSVATALILFEAARQREKAGMYLESRLSANEFDRRLFEWAYPSIAASRNRSGRPYPPLTADGELIRGS